MKQISREQWNRLGQDSFDARMVAVIRRHHPEQAARIDFPALVGAIQRQTARARAHGLSDERSVATYVHTAWLMGEEFDRRIPAVAQILADKAMSAADKARALTDFSRLVFRAVGGSATDASRRVVQ
ncbi:MAG: hypothetical protein JF586_23480 [Burkholderiales bacterium]|nr:hypothetical protein [Burkholderiales bacterium]